MSGGGRRNGGGGRREDVPELLPPCWLMPLLLEFEGEAAGEWGRVPKEVGVRVLGEGPEEGQSRGFH